MSGKFESEGGHQNVLYGKSVAEHIWIEVGGCNFRIHLLPKTLKGINCNFFFFHVSLGLPLTMFRSSGLWDVINIPVIE